MKNSKPKNLIAKIFQAICYWPFYLGFRFHVHFEVEGQENLKGFEDGAIIFASNHCNYLDSPMCAAIMPRDFFGLFPWKFFPIRFLAYKEFFGWKNRFPFPVSIFVALYVRLNGSICVDRTSFPKDLEKILVNAVSALKNGDRVWIYPEGKMSADGKLSKKYGRGLAYLHQQTGAPIIPAGIIGSHEVTLKNFFLRRKKVKIKIGKPIYSITDLSFEDGANKVMAEVEKLMK